MTYDIISVIINQYDQPVKNHDHTANKRLLTDTNYKVNGWDTRLLEHVDHRRPFNTVFNIRWHPFNYSNADYVIWVDGSLEVTSSLLPLVKQFADSGADIGLLQHPDRNDIFTEYAAWIRIRNYPKVSAYKWMYLLENYVKCDIYHSGLIQTNIIMYKNSKRCIEWCHDVWNFLHLLDNKNVDRLDQTIVTALRDKINTYLFYPDVYKKSLYFISHYNH